MCSILCMFNFYIAISIRIFLIINFITRRLTKHFYPHDLIPTFYEVYRADIIIPI